MAARHQDEPSDLWHYSEDPLIGEFVPHVPATNPDQPSLVWAVDDPHAPLFWFPRDCPRITFWADDGSPPDALGATTATRVHAIESVWLERMQTVALFVYRFDVRDFSRWPGADGYWVSERAQRPLDVTPVGDLLALHRERGIELRILDDLRPLRDAVLASGYRFSMSRMANLSPAPGGGSGTG